MKKYISLIMAAVMLFSLSSCSKSTGQSVTGNSNTAQTDEIAQADTEASAEINKLNEAMQSIYMPCRTDEIPSLGEDADSTWYLTQMLGKKQYSITYKITDTDHSIRIFADDKDTVRRKQLVLSNIPELDFTEKQAMRVEEGMSLADAVSLLGEGINISSWLCNDENGAYGDVYDCYVWLNGEGLQLTALVLNGEIVKYQLGEKREITLPDNAPTEDEQVLPQIIFMDYQPAKDFSALCEKDGVTEIYDGFSKINYGSTVSDVENLMGTLTDGEENEEYFTKIFEQGNFKAEFYFAKENSRFVPYAGAPELLYQAKMDYTLPENSGVDEIRKYKADALFDGMSQDEAEYIIGIEGVYCGPVYDEEDSFVYRCYRYDSAVSTLYVYYDFSPERTLTVRRAQLEQKQGYSEYGWESYVSGEDFVFVGE